MALAQSQELLHQSGLIYVADGTPGYSRKKSGKGFAYYDPQGKLTKDKKLISRIKKLVIPPAYTDVWICPIENGHLQATGRDQRGRKQYRYHPDFIALSSENKFERMVPFGSALPHIRERVDADLSKSGLAREKVLATVVWFLEKSLIRVGNDEYARTNKSYGLTTMRMRHCRVEGAAIRFKFVGKRGIKHDIVVSDRRMARLVRRIQEIPGQELFQYRDENGDPHSVSSAEVNAYLKEISGRDFTAKDFRTWSGTILALIKLSAMPEFVSDSEARRNVAKAMRQVAAHLGNTPAICRRSYVHPRLVESYADGSLTAFLERGKFRFDEEPAANAEKALLKFLKQGEGKSNLLAG